MAELKNRSIRVDDEVWAAIQALPGRTQNDALRSALFGNGSDADAKISEILELTRTMAAQRDEPFSREERDESRRVEDSRPKNATCRHCGERFAGQRFATLCPNCKSTGHTNQPNECPRCNEGMGI